MTPRTDGLMDAHSQQHPIPYAAEGPQKSLMPKRFSTVHGRAKEAPHHWFDHLLAECLPLAPKAFVKPFAMRYVAGETLEAMLNTVRELNQKGIVATVDLLGEFITQTQEARQNADAYLEILDQLAQHQLKSNVSVKLSALGLLLDESLCFELMCRLLQKAQDTQNFVRIDMEDSDCTEATIQLYLRLREQYSNVGIVMQAYLRRTHDDVRRILTAGAGHFRLCKGIYVEPRWVAYQDGDIINRNYEAVLDTMFSAGAYVGIATHDEKLVWVALKLIQRYQLQPHQYEFQMLLGVDHDLRDMLVASGHTVRVYVPYGQQWHAYCMRRLKENPKIARYILQNLLKH